MYRKLFLSLVIGALVLSLGFVAPASAAPSSARLAALAAPAWHWVQPGETLFSIGRLYGVNPWSISSANGLANPNRIYIGQLLYIPASPNPYPGCGVTYTVRFGDTLLRIGRAYGVSVWSIAAANGLYNLNTIYAGQPLHIPCR